MRLGRTTSNRKYRLSLSKNNSIESYLTLVFNKDQRQVKVGVPLSANCVFLSCFLAYLFKQVEKKDKRLIRRHFISSFLNRFSQHLLQKYVLKECFELLNLSLIHPLLYYIKSVTSDLFF